MANESLEFRVSEAEKDIVKIDGELKGLQQEMRKQEDRMEKKIEEKFHEFELKLDKSVDSQAQKSDRILQALESLKDGQHKQDIKNFETDTFLKQLLQDREEQKEEAKKFKWWLMTIAGGLISSILLKLYVTFGTVGISIFVTFKEIIGL